MHRSGIIRLRWRLRGAWLAPAAAATVVLDIVILELLPIAGEHGPGVIGGILIGGFADLLAIVLLAPLGGRLLRRRRPDLPRGVARNYAGVALVLAASLVLLGAGLAHRPAIEAQRRDYLAQLSQVAAYVDGQAPAYRKHLGEASTIRLAPDYYRTCVPGDSSRHRLCLFVDTSQSPPGITLDTAIEPNAAIVRFEGG